MSLFTGLTTNDLETIFRNEIADAGGTVHDIFNDGSRLFARSILPYVREVRPKDRMQGGVALRAGEDEVWVHPYLFREVCRNGAIVATTIKTVHLELNWVPAQEAESRVRAAVQCCTGQDAFTIAAEHVKTASESVADLALNLMPYLGRMASRRAESLLGEILARFANEPDSSRFGLMNAVTSLARDARDPELRWQLEELGGAIAMARTAPVPVDAAAREPVVA